MLSYQHSYHAGNLADVHKHSLLAWMLDYLMLKDKPLSYIETHSGRGLYSTAHPDAVKTGEAAQGILRVQHSIASQHPYKRVLSEIQKKHGPDIYPGSPAIAAASLRAQDKLFLAELHPKEFQILARTMRGQNISCAHKDGFEFAYSQCPPTPRRGLMLIDPSYEVKSDYEIIPKHIHRFSKAWNVGIICLWYPILRDRRHTAMTRTLTDTFPNAFKHEVDFPPAKDGHGMIGSGMFIVNPPYGVDGAAAQIGELFKIT